MSLRDFIVRCKHSSVHNNMNIALIKDVIGKTMYREAIVRVGYKCNYFANHEAYVCICV